MVRRHVAALRLALMAADGLSAVFVFIAVSVFRFGADEWQTTWRAVGVEGPILALAYGAAWVAIVWFSGLYRLRARWAARTEVVDVFRAVIALAVATFVVLFWFKLPNVSRQFLLLLFPAQLVLTIASRAVLRWMFAAARSRGMNSRFMLVVGTGRTASGFANRVERRREMGLHVIGHLALPDARPGGRLRRPILGTVDDIERVLHSQVVDEIAICLPPSHIGLIEPIARLCEEEGRIVRIPTDDTGLTLPGARIEEFDGQRVMSLVYGPDRTVALIIKRAADVVLSAAALLVLSPLLALIALRIRIQDGSPVLFGQTRVGLHGRPFRIVKFRTMVPDAEALQSELLGDNELAGPVFKITEDPRISRSGRFLRSSGLDELPQLWNVLRGQMSLVGPRPPIAAEVDRYDVWHRRRLSMKPGITGLWQVGARREAEFDRWVRMDLEYIDRWSLWLDVKIIARTIPAMLAQEGR
jgi:exopolysaccharide biosynthesis polyprenyl glycosylphosphotransferase